jgi:HlyD family secretion protein
MGFAFSRFFAALFLSGLVLSGCGRKAGGSKSQSASYEFAEIRRGTLERSVSSSGTINPVSTVKVLPRMSGKVEKIHVDYNDMVTNGQILAELNTDMLRLQREQQLAQVVKTRANYELQGINFQNLQSLAQKNLISEYELKSGKTTLDIQAAELAAAEANLKVIETEINQYAFITSPIDGIVLERNINVGDTVVDSSSNNSSNIFTLAENLQEMRIEAGVGELDITSIRKDQPVRFTLESLPGRTFTGEVETLRMIPAVQYNVVSYTVIINVENRDGSLLPGMTCAVEFIVERSENALMVPNAALRYQPTSLSADEIADMVFEAGLRGLSEERRQAALEARAQAKAAAPSPGQGQSPGSGGPGLAGLVGAGMPVRMGPGGGRPPGQAAPGLPGGQGRTRSGEGGAVIMRNLWYINDQGKLEVMRVRAGISDGIYTEIRPLEDRSSEDRPSGDRPSGDRPPEARPSGDLEGKKIILREKI